MWKSALLMIGLLSAPALAQDGRSGGSFQVDHRLESIFQKVLPFTQRRDLSYRLLLQRDDSTINAYALPDGRIILTTGLVHALPHGDNNAVAFVIAHELSHLERRHIERLARQDNLTNLGLGLLVRNQSDVLRSAAGVGSRLITSGYSRGMESEADASGLELMRRAGYSPRGAITTLQLFRNLEATRGRTRVFPTHPTAVDRLRDAEAYVQQHGY